MRCRTLLLLLLSPFACNEEGSAPATIAPGRGTFVYTGHEPLREKPVTLHYFIPEGDAAAMSILFLFPGTERNAGDYLESWITAARANGCMVFSFEFPKTHYSSNEYITGNVMDDAGHLLPAAQRSFAIIEPAFDYIRQATGCRDTRYGMFGHSAGAQFVHRYVLFNPAARVDKAIAANAGWYTLPDLAVDFPHGLKGTGLTTDDVKQAFLVNLTVHLGTADTRQDASLNTSPGAMLQGPHRHARGVYFYTNSQSIATRAAAPFLWTRRDLPGVGHDQARMAADAATLLFGSR
jgi:alpha-beta hydrolase superfamily lysophospholipase